MDDRIRIESGAPWENIVGYSRAVKAGNNIEISGTVALDDSGALVGEGDPAEQTRAIIRKAANVLERLGSGLHEVVRTRIYVTDIRQWESVGKAHGEFFSSIKPATSMLQVAALIRPEYLVEIEFSAICQS